MADLSQLKLPNNQTYNIKDSAAVKAVTWDTTNKKITKTINGTTTDVVTGETILNGITSNQITTGLGYTPPHQPMGTASGNIATFEAAGLPLSKLRVAITAQQDLGGYDSPWVGGGGKNLFNKDAPGKLAGYALDYSTGNTYQTSSGNYSVSDYIPVVAGQTYIASGNSKTTDYCWYDSGKAFISGGGDIDTAKTAPSNAAFLRIDYWKADENVVQLEAGPTATAYAPYSNECPISGWTACNVVRTGVNIWNEEWEVGSIADSDGQNATNSNYRRSKNYISVKANKRYYFNVPNKYGTTYRFYQYKQNKDYIGIKAVGSDGTFETDNDCAFIRFRIATTEDYTNDISINYPSTDTEYHAYNGQTYTINFVDGSSPLIVYGGTLDVVSGELVVDRVLANLGNCAWTYQATNKVFYTTSISDYLFNSSISAICSQYGYIGTVGGGTASLRDDEYNGKCAFYYLSTGVSREFYIKDLAYDDATAFKQAMNGVQLVYELATPQTYQLTPTEVKSLRGLNQIWANTGNVLNAEYVTKEYNNLVVGSAEKVTQSIAGSDSYNILMSGSNDDYGSTTLTETVKKATSLKYNNGGSMLILENGDFNISLCVGGLSNISVGKQKVITGTSNKYKHYIDYTSDDITMHTNNSSYPNTWDGTNTSLKTAVTNAGSTVSQNNTIKDEFLPILFSYTSGVTSKTEEAAINTNFKYNPSLEALTVGSRLSGTTTGTNSVSIGTTNTASASYSYAEGYLVVASGQYSHAEGYYSTASGKYSHAECNHTTASGQSSHAEGDHTTASGQYSHAEGIYTTAQRKSQHVFGEYNVLDTTGADGTVRGSYVEIVGKGTGSNARSNARTLDWSGNEWIAGTYSNGSSRKLKTNIESLTNFEALKVLELNPVKFDFISAETNDQRERGFIAEEVMNVIPQVAFKEETDEDGNITKPASLNYIGLIPYLVKMIQIQQKEIDELKNK